MNYSQVNGVRVLRPLFPCARPFPTAASPVECSIFSAGITKEEVYNLRRGRFTSGTAAYLLSWKNHVSFNTIRVYISSLWT